MAINFLSGIDVDNGVLYTDTTNNRVGVNQTSPIGAVHILGPNTNSAMTTSALVVEQSDGAKILIDGNDIDAAAGMLYLNDYSTNDVVFGGQIRVGGGGSPVGNSWFANGNVGIGTTSPAQKLDVAGDATFDGRIYSNATALASVGILGKAIANGWAARYDSNNANYSGFYFDTNNHNIIIGRVAGGTITNYIAASGSSYFNGGNVGIGETNPAQKLHVIGNSEITGDIFLGRYIFHNDDTNTWLGFPLADTISFRTNGSDRMYITSSGNVGIGTTSPSSKLQVFGDLTVGDDGRVGSWINVIAAGSGQDAGIRFGSESNTDSKAAIYTNTSNSDLHFDVTESTRMLIDSATGNVGIGTTSPSGLLHVSSGTSGDAVVIIEADTDNNNENDNPQLQFKQDAGGIVAKAGLIGDPGQIFTNSLGNGAYFGTDANASVQFYTNATAALTIREDGDVGIGTTNPGKLLELSGGANAACIRLRDTTSNVWDIQNSTLGKLDFIRGGTNTYMRIDQFGNVGIGTTSPSGRLTIGSGATTDNSTMFNVNGQYNDVGFNGGTSGLLTQGVWSFINSATWDQTRFYVQDQNNVASRLTFDFRGNAGNTNILAGTSTGNVGIGTTSPSSPLHIQKTLSGGQVMAYFDGTVGPSTYGALNVRVDNIDYGTGMRFYRSGIYDSGAIGFINGTSTVGSININTSSTSYNTTSDYRLKENLTEITDGIDRIKQLKPKRFNFIGDTTVVDGFIAHEAKQVVPEAVTGEKDEVLPNGDPVYQGIDQAKIVPLLTAALQEAITKIEVLENRLQILENK